MSKLTTTQKLEMYHKRKAGYTIPALSKEYNIRTSNIEYLISLIDNHGENIIQRERKTFTQRN